MVVSSLHAGCGAYLRRRKKKKKHCRKSGPPRLLFLSGSGHKVNGNKMLRNTILLQPLRIPRVDSFLVYVMY